MVVYECCPQCIHNGLQYNKQHVLPLEDVKLQSLENDGRKKTKAVLFKWYDSQVYFSAWKNGWQVISPKKSFAVFAATPTEKAEWMAHINKCIVDLLAKSELLSLLCVWCKWLSLSIQLTRNQHRSMLQCGYQMAMLPLVCIVSKPSSHPSTEE